MTRSGTVGRVTLAYDVLRGVMVSDDLVRIVPKDRSQRGWLYAFLLSPRAQAMMTTSRYGQLIKHIEPSHLEALPIPDVTPKQARDFEAMAAEVVRLRGEAVDALRQAEDAYAGAFGKPRPSEGKLTFSKGVAALSGLRRRLDAAHHNPVAAEAERVLSAGGRRMECLDDLGFEAWLPNRFERVPAEAGVDLWSSSALLEVGARPARRIAEGPVQDPFAGRVSTDWILMPRSGQVYGIIGNAVLAPAAFDGGIVSDHVIRIRPLPAASVRAGYLVVAMSHPTLGLPRVKALACGSSIPEIDVGDLRRLRVPRLDPDVEQAVAEYAEASASARDEADRIEADMAKDADRIIADFGSEPVLRLAGGRGDNGAVSNGSDDADDDSEFRRLAEQWRSGRGPVATVARMTKHPAYRQIVNMGEAAIPLILSEFRRSPDHWDFALREITGDNPAPEKDWGDLWRVRDAWLAWGKRNGYN